MGSEHVEMVDDDKPEWTHADFARARPGREVLPPEVLNAFGRQRGRPRSPEAKKVVTLRLRPSLIAAYAAQGPDWRARMEGVLTEGAKRAADAVGKR